VKYPDLTKYDEIFFDTETTGLDWWKDTVFGVSISAADRDWYWDIRREPEALSWLREEIPRVKRLAAHHAKFDWHFARELGIHFPEGRVVCTMIRAALIDEHRLTYDLDSLGKDCVGVGKDTSIYQELADLFGGKPTKHAQIANLPRAPVAMAARYAKQDTRTGLMLLRWQEDQIERQDLGRVHDLEMRLLPAIVRMEHGGVRVDVSRAERAVVEIDKRAREGQKALDRMAGFPVNPNPSSSIHKLFDPKESRDAAGNKIWTLNDGTIALPTDAGKASIDAACLRRMKHPAAAGILDLRKMLKARDTFLKGHVLGNHHDGVIHANINQTKSEGDVGTGTGRLSINGPALQQIPKRDKDMAAIVRAVFVPDYDQDWVCNDWAQMDFRIFAHYVNDADMLQMYRDDPTTDFHQLTAGMTGLPRSPRFAGDPNAKQINLGLVFGMGQGTLAEEMGLPFTIEPNGRGGTWKKPGPEAEQVFETYHANVHGVRDLLRDASSVAKSRGYVKTAMGRRIRFPRGMFVHKAGGLIFQGTAADALKIKLVELDQYMQTLDGDARLLLNVHDEFDHSIAPHRKDIREEINHIVTQFGPGDVLPLRVPVLTDQGIGPDWHEASK
jgi:DNA polymerase I-like protein with 3'-5' exonuclease and polymerase domains